MRVEEPQRAIMLPVFGLRLRTWLVAQALIRRRDQVLGTDRRAPVAGADPSSRFGRILSEPVDYTPTVVEVDADVCVEHNGWRHGTVFRRVRPDLAPGDLTT